MCVDRGVFLTLSSRYTDSAQALFISVCFYRYHLSNPNIHQEKSFIFFIALLFFSNTFASSWFAWSLAGRATHASVCLIENPREYHRYPQCLCVCVSFITWAVVVYALIGDYFSTLSPRYTESTFISLLLFLFYFYLHFREFIVRVAPRG